MARRPASLVSQAIVTAVCLAIGLGISFFFGLPMYRKAQASQTWPTTTGTIETSQVTETFQKGRRRYSPSVSYSYEIGGQRLTSKYIWASGGDSSTNREPHQAVVDKYQVGSPVKVFYDPQNPGFAILEPGITTTNYIVLGGGGAILLAGAIMAVATGVQFARARD